MVSENKVGSTTTTAQASRSKAEHTLLSSFSFDAVEPKAVAAFAVLPGRCKKDDNEREL